MIDRGDLGLVEPDRDELGQPAVLADHAEGAVPGVDQPNGRLGDPAQHGFQLKIRADAHHGLEQRVDPIAGVEHLLQPQLELAEQLVKLQARNDDRAVL